jgi:hypothetical protein
MVELLVVWLTTYFGGVEPDASPGGDFSRRLTSARY